MINGLHLLFRHDVFEAKLEVAILVFMLELDKLNFRQMQKQVRVTLCK